MTVLLAVPRKFMRHLARSSLSATGFRLVSAWRSSTHMSSRLGRIRAGQPSRKSTATGSAVACSLPIFLTGVDRANPGGVRRQVNWGDAARAALVQGRVAGRRHSRRDYPRCGGVISASCRPGPMPSSRAVVARVLSCWFPAHGSGRCALGAARSAAWCRTCGQVTAGLRDVARERAALAVHVPPAFSS